MLFSVFALAMHAHEKHAFRQYADSAIWQGMTLRADIGNMALTALQSRGDILQYEVAATTNLKNKFYPILEAGYASAQHQGDSTFYHGEGGFARIGLDLNPMRKSRNGDYFLTVGLRAGMALQELVPEQKMRFDCWGEVVAGVQVKVVAGWVMGWQLRFHALFTDRGKTPAPYYIPGYGKTGGSALGVNYFVGYRF